MDRRNFIKGAMACMLVATLVPRQLTAGRKTPIEKIVFRGAFLRHDKYAVALHATGTIGNYQYHYTELFDEKDYQKNQVIYHNVFMRSAQKAFERAARKAA